MQNDGHSQLVKAPPKKRQRCNIVSCKSSAASPDSGVVANIKSNDGKTSNMDDYMKNRSQGDSSNDKENQATIQDGGNSCNKKQIGNEMKDQTALNSAVFDNNHKNHVPNKIEDEQEEDIDVAQAKKYKELKPTEAVSIKTFATGNVLSNIVSHLSVVEIIKLRGINKLFNNELEFGFECYNFNIFFKYKNKYIIDIINHQYCGKLEIFTLFYLQSINLKKSGFVFTRKEAITAPPAPLDDKIGLTSRYVVSVDVNRTEKQEQSNHDSLGEMATAKHDNQSVRINLFKDTYVKTKGIIERVQLYERSHHDAIEILLLARYYHFKPLENAIRDLILDDSDFRTFLDEYVTDSTADVYLEYILDRAPKPPCERSFLINSMLLGGFDLYAAFLKSYQDDVISKVEFNVKVKNIFNIAAIFLRPDVAMNFIGIIPSNYAAETLEYVIQPQLLVEYGQKVIENCIFSLSDKDAYKFDLLNNPRYHPRSRMRYIFMMMSIRFPRILSQYSRETKMINTVDKLNDSFDDFKNDWLLDHYPDFHNDIKKQKDFHQLFKYCIKVIFDITKYDLCPDAISSVASLLPKLNEKIDTLGIAGHFAIIANGVQYFDAVGTS